MLKANQFIAVLSVTAAAAQITASQDAMDADAYLQALAPGAEHEQMSRLTGAWWVHGRMRVAPDQPWDILDAHADMQMTLDGMHLRMTIQAQQSRTWPKPYQSERYLGFDTLHKRWQLFIADNLGTQTHLAQGNATHDPRTITVSDELEWPVSQRETVRVRWRGVFTIESDDRFVWREYLQYPNQDENVGIEAVFTRKPGPSSRLIGSWLGVDGAGNKMRFTFALDSSVVWTVSTPGGEYSYNLQYTFDKTQGKLDIIGMSEGPIAGRTLYSIIEFLDDDSLRLDLEPGKPGSTGDGVRPEHFNEDEAVVFTRQ